MLDTLLGGLLAILGGWVAAWYAAKNVRKSRMDEIVAERKVSANAEAYSHVKEIQSHFLQSGAEQTLKVMLDREAWFFSNRLFLPGEFPAKWLSVRNDISKYRRWEFDESKTLDEKLALSKRIETTLTEAIEEIYRDMNLRKIVIEKNRGQFV